ncbi:hypothetical protein Tco_0428485 [Tanacetum coccineum]
MMTRIAIRKKIMCILATFLHKKPKTLSFPKEIEEIKEQVEEVSSDVPINTIVMPIRITFDNPIDFNDHFSKPKDLKKDLPISFYSTTTSILPHPLLDSDSPFTAELSASITLNSLGNKDNRGDVVVPIKDEDNNVVNFLSYFVPLKRPKGMDMSNIAKEISQDTNTRTEIEYDQELKSQKRQHR